MLPVDAIKRVTYQILLKYAPHLVGLLKCPPAGIFARQKAEFNSNATQTDEDLEQTDNVLHQYFGVTMWAECASANTALLLLFHLCVFLFAADLGVQTATRAPASRCCGRGAPH